MRETFLFIKQSRLNYKNLFFLFSSTFLFLGVIIYINYNRITVYEYDQYLLSLTVLEQYILFFCLLVPVILIGYNISRFLNVTFASVKEHIILLGVIEIFAVILWVIHPTVSVFCHSIGLFFMGVFMGFWKNSSQSVEISINENVKTEYTLPIIMVFAVLLIIFTLVIAFQYPELYKFMTAIEFALGILSALIGQSYFSNSN